MQVKFCAAHWQAEHFKVEETNSFRRRQNTITARKGALSQAGLHLSLKHVTPMWQMVATLIQCYHLF